MPGKISPDRLRYIGNECIDRLIINGIIPFLFFYAGQGGSGKFRDYGTGILEEMPPESNAIIKKWIKFGIRPATAFESQGLLYLYRQYCKHGRCLDCQFGNNFIIDGKKPP